MRIFVGYHYGPGDAWVKTYVYRLVRAFGDEVESGENLYLNPYLADGVQEKIENSDALIGVASCNQQLANGFFSAFPWVRDELVVAKDRNKLFVQLRETNLDPNEGFLAGAQYIEFDKADLTECVLKLAEAIGQWHSLRELAPYLLPKAFAETITPYVDSDGLVCHYELLNAQFKKTRGGKSKVVRTPGRLQVLLPGVRTSDVWVQITITFGTHKWTSGLEPLDSPAINMEPA